MPISFEKKGILTKNFFPSKHLAAVTEDAPDSHETRALVGKKH